MKRTLLLVWLISILPVAAFVGLVEYGDRRRTEFLREAEGRAEGTIVRLVEKRGKYIRYFPVVEFTPREGRQVEFRSDYPDGFPPSLYKVGQRVPVVYVPAAPSRAEIDQPGLHAKNVTPFRTAGGIWVGVMTLLCGGLAVVLRPRKRPAPAAGPLDPA
jgi:hypothetical protein